MIGAAESGLARKVEEWYASEPEEVAELLGVDPERGLDAEERARRLAREGPNELTRTPPEPAWRLFARQFADALVLLLVVAAGVSVAIGEWLDGLVIAAILLANAALGFVHAWRARKEVSSLSDLLVPQARVRIDGRSTLVTARELVPGDVVELALGLRVPADLRLVEAQELRVDESPLTGESDSVAKDSAPLAPGTPLAERASIAHLGTTVTSGRGLGIVVATGARTEFGRIAMITSAVVSPRTPLQRRLDRLGRRLGLAALAIAGAIGLGGWAAGLDPLAMFLTAVSLAVAAVPEGLPAVVTVTLALGVRAMVARRALLRNLSAAETLGSATVICSDKTGTLTRGEMSVQSLAVAAGTCAVEEAPDELARALWESAAACNHARVERVDGSVRAVGEPTEVALLLAAERAGAEPPPRAAVVLERPFDSTRKRMSVLERRAEGSWRSHVKGAPEVLLERATAELAEGGPRPLDGADRERLSAAAHELAARGLRTLAIARRDFVGDEPRPEEMEEELVWLGIAGILDAPRVGVDDAVALAQRAGIRVIMITGDAAATARAVAERIGLGSGEVVTGSELDRIDAEGLARALSAPVHFARVTSEHKLRIVECLQGAGEVVAMTGDGVNDAPALRRADIGVAMGIRGTDVAREAADMVLLDDDFSTVVSAVEEGRRQVQNVRKFVGYLLSSNLAEVVAVGLGLWLFRVPLLLPAQILWINLVTDGLTAVALGLEPVEPGAMSRPPRPLGAGLFDRREALSISGLGIALGAATLGLFALAREAGAEVEAARTLAFTGLAALELANLWNFRAMDRPLVPRDLWGNPWLLGSAAGALLLQFAALHVAPLARALRVAPLGPEHWSWIALAALPVVVVPDLLRRGARSRAGRRVRRPSP